MRRRLEGPLAALFEKDPYPPWRDEWDDLARYNAEVSRGLVHTPEWRKRMAALQRDFDEAHRVARHQPPLDGVHVPPDGY